MGKVKQAATAWPNVEGFITCSDDKLMLKELESELLEEAPSFGTVPTEQQTLNSNNVNNNSNISSLIQYFSIPGSNGSPLPTATSTSHTQPHTFTFTQHPFTHGDGTCISTCSGSCNNSSATTPSTPLSTPQTPLSMPLTPLSSASSCPSTPLSTPQTPLTPMSPMTPLTPQTPLSAPDTPISAQSTPSQYPPGMPQPTITPLSPGGFIYQYVPASYPPHPVSYPPSMPPPPAYYSFAHSIPPPPQPMPPPPQTTVFTYPAPVTTNVSPAILSKQEKLEKYRQKRNKRNWSRNPDQNRSQRANSRTRDEFGQFLAKPESQKDLEDMKHQLAASQRESQLLRERLAAVLNELMVMKKRVEETTMSQQEMQKELEQQQRINEKLRTENRYLWATVPRKEVFNTLQQRSCSGSVAGTSPPNSSSTFVDVDPFKEKIDFSQLELTWTDSPFLGTSKEEDSIDKLDVMSFISSAPTEAHSS